MSGIQESLLVYAGLADDAATVHMAIDFAVRHARPGMQRTAILSDLEQSGLTSEALYREVARHLEAAGYERLLAVGPVISAANFPPSIQVERFPDADALLQALSNMAFERQVILVKGAPHFRLERVVDRLAERLHGTRMVLDLDALANNLHAYREAVGAETKLAVMVKAFGYGTGEAEIARTLAFHQVDYLGVAYTDEGISLRNAGIETPIFILNAAPDTWDACLRFGLEPQVHTPDQLQAVRTNYPALPLHLNLETGMHRLGLTAPDVDALCQNEALLRGLQLASVFGHLATADDPAQDAFTQRQIDAFEQLSEMLLLAWRSVNPDAPEPIRHVANSAGALRFPAARYGMVRLGIGMYGYDPVDILAPSLEPVASLFTTVSQIRSVAAGESIGYGGHAILDRATRVATLGIGYADGFRRVLGNGRASVYAHGKRMPVIGNVCMDMIMVDASACPDLAIGDDVEIFGRHIRLEEVAAWAETISYEVLAGVSSRVKRVFLSR